MSVPAAPLAVQVSPYAGLVAPRFDSPALRAWLAELPRHLAGPSATTIAAGRNRHVRIVAPLAGGDREVLVKVFGRSAWLHDLRDRARGSKARRSWLAAEHMFRHGVGTPEPVACIERWSGSRLAESYFIAIFEPHAQTFRDALIELYHERPQAPAFMALLGVVAQGVRRMHDAGFVHNDLGNANILLASDAQGGWDGFQVIDLNRGRLRAEVSERERARDLARLDLPSHLRNVLQKMYWNSARLPREFERAARTYYKLHRLRVRSRRWRHPLREARLARSQAKQAMRGMPPARDLWIWDERCGQPLAPMLSAERHAHLPMSRNLLQFAETLAIAPGLWRDYTALRSRAFANPVELAGRIGMSVEPGRVGAERELELLSSLGAALPVLVRLYHHETGEATQQRVAFIRRLHVAGHPVMVALVQDRRAVRDTASWATFLEHGLAELGDIATAFEIGHAINRSKWGIWGFEDVAALYAPIAKLHARYPGVRFTGPAAIDFEYPFAVSALRRWPAGVPLAALSHHLYVDRRGAPEATQAGFGAVEKFALARAIARQFPGCADRLVISEVNWPIVGTAPWCPVSAPHVLPGHRSGHVAVSEDDYANYMLRYYLLALCSGLVDQVYWWRLSSHGFGLVDDLDPAHTRLRPAYHALQRFVALLGDATFTGASRPSGNDRAGAYRFEFRRRDGERVALAYAHGVPVPLDRSSTGKVEDLFGQALREPPATLTSRPVYLRDLAP